MPPASSRNIGVARFDASSRACISGKLLCDLGVPSGSLMTTPPCQAHEHYAHRCRIERVCQMSERDLEGEPSSYPLQGGSVETPIVQTNGPVGPVRTRGSATLSSVGSKRRGVGRRIVSIQSLKTTAPQTCRSPMFSVMMDANVSERLTTRHRPTRQTH